MSENIYLPIPDRSALIKLGQDINSARRRRRITMVKNKLLIVIFFIGTEMLLFSNGTQEDLYVGKTIDQVVLQLGKPSSDNFKVIDENYIGFESEPDYSLFFSLDELRETVTIRILTWAKGNDSIIVWGKRTSNEWEIFSSLRIKKNTFY